MIRPSPARRRHGLAAVAASCCLAAALPASIRAAGEPGPVPLLRDASPAAEAAPPPRHAVPAALGDWRLVAALGATFAVLIGVRTVASRRATPLPPDVFEVLGTASLGAQHAVRVVRFGPKTLLVGVSASGATTLAEIGDPQATACIAAACRGIQPQPRQRPRPAPSGGAATAEAA